MKRLVLTMIVGLCLAGSAFGGSYGFIDLKVSWSGPTIDVAGVTSRNDLVGDADGTFQNADALAVANNFGQLNGTTQEIYCLELTEFSSGSFQTYEIVDLEDLQEVDPFEAVQIRKMIEANGGTIGAGTNANKVEEQVAAWEIVHDDLVDVTAVGAGPGGFAASDPTGGVVLANAQALLDAIADEGGEAQAFGLLRQGSQDFGVLVLGGGESVPEPAMIFNLVGLALVGGALSFRRMRRNKK